MGFAKDYSGVKLGMLTLIKRVGTNTHGSPIWTYVCDCGNTGEISVQCFKIVKHHSCGCKSAFNNNPRVKNHTLLKAFYSMHKRCYDEKDEHYHQYGGRGIIVCERWHKFDNYYDDVILTWKKGLWADRINFNGNYEPNNFRWVTPQESGRNTRSVKLNEDKVRLIRNSPLTNMELSKQLNVHYDTVRQVRKGIKWVGI